MQLKIMDYREPAASPFEAEFTPPTPPTEKKQSWRLFDFLKPKESAETADTLGAEREKPATLRFGEAIVRLLGLRPEQRQSEATETAQPAAAETSPEQPTIVERAKDMGRNVLRLIKGVREDVVAADEHEAVSQPTDIAPLIEADEEVREAMEELIAPITEHARQPAAEEHLSDVGPDLIIDHSQTSEATADTDLGGSQPVPERGSGLSMLRAAEMAMAAAAAVTVERLERPRHASAIKKLGVLALGGALVYTLHRQRQIKKEQKRQKQELKKFEAEVRQEQQATAERVQQLERTEAEKLNQAKRQEHVLEVSRFALGRAEEIRTVATFMHHQEEQERVRHVPRIERIATATPIPERLVAPLPPSVAENLPEITPPPIFTRAELPATPERPPLAPIRKEIQNEQPSVMERITGTLTGRQNSGQGVQGQGATGGLMSRLLGVTPTQKQDAAGQKQQQQDQQQPVPPQPSQAWLLGVGLALGIGVLLLIAMGIL